MVLGFIRFKMRHLALVLHLKCFATYHAALLVYFTISAGEWTSGAAQKTGASNGWRHLQINDRLKSENAASYLSISFDGEVEPLADDPVVPSLGIIGHEDGKNYLSRSVPLSGVQEDGDMSVEVFGQSKTLVNTGADSKNEKRSTTSPPMREDTVSYVSIDAEGNIKTEESGGDYMQKSIQDGRWREQASTEVPTHVQTKPTGTDENVFVVLRRDVNMNNDIITNDGSHKRVPETGEYMDVFSVMFLIASGAFLVMVAIAWGS